MIEGARNTMIIVGIIIAVIGVVLLLLGMSGRAIGGRKHWY
jgi:hypothetical protein